MRWFGLAEYITLGTVAALVIAVVLASMLYDRRERQRRREWHRSYFLRDGLVRALRRWDRTPRLTDQSSQPERPSE